MAEISLELIGAQLERVISYLRVNDEKVDRLANDVRDIKVRLTALETVNGRLDRLEDRIDRIERRLGLIEVPPA